MSTSQGSARSARFQRPCWLFRADSQRGSSAKSRGLLSPSRGVRWCVGKMRRRNMVLLQNRGWVSTPQNTYPSSVQGNTKVGKRWEHLPPLGIDSVETPQLPSSDPLSSKRSFSLRMHAASCDRRTSWCARESPQLKLTRSPAGKC